MFCIYTAVIDKKCFAGKAIGLEEHTALPGSANVILHGVKWRLLKA